MIDVRGALLKACPKDLFLDLEDRLRAEALNAHRVVQKEFSLNTKRSREAEGQIRFRLQEQGFEEVVALHGGNLITGGVLPETQLKFFQPFARFSGAEVGIILGFAAMPEKRKIPPKNISRLAGVTLNAGLQFGLFDNQNTPQPNDIFVLFLAARDKLNAGFIAEIAVGVIGSDYQDFLFYESLEDFLNGYASDPTPPADPEANTTLVTLRSKRPPFIPPEKHAARKADDGTSG